MIKEYCSVTQIENEWRKISEQGNINYCQSYLWTKYTEEFCAGNIFKKLYFGNVRYFCYFDGDNCTMILPTQLKGKTAHLLGWKTPNDYEGFLYHTEVWGGVLRDMLDYISTRYGIKTFDFGFNTPKQNNFIPLLTELPENEWIIEKEESFNVMLPYTFESFEEYFKTLSKSTRQNYRTAINRLRKDGKSFSFDFYENEIPEIEMNNFLKDHKERLSNRYLNNRSAIVEKTLEPARRLIYGKYRRDGIAALSMKKGNNQILAVMKIDNKNAAYYYGLISESSEMKRINFFRVCVNDTEFGFYSPGMILGMEIIKKYQAEFSIYDFTKGDESYKYKFGCQNEDDFFVRIKRK